MAALQLGKDCKTKCREMPEREMNSERQGALPSCLAMAAMEFKICFLSGMVWRPVEKRHHCECGYHRCSLLSIRICGKFLAQEDLRGVRQANKGCPKMKKAGVISRS